MAANAGCRHQSQCFVTLERQGCPKMQRVLCSSANQLHRMPEATKYLGTPQIEGPDGKLHTSAIGKVSDVDLGCF